jgi:SAM-dependent methyltransferase
MHHPAFNPEVDQALRVRLTALCAAGWEIFERFEAEVRDRRFHPFIASEYEVVLAALLAHRGPGLRFLELGSASGVIAIMADLLGYDACGIEIDESLVTTARDLATRFDSNARFVAGSFFPAGYVYRPRDGSGGAVPLGDGLSGYVQLGHALDDFDIVFGFPWGGEEAMMLDLMRCYGRPDATLLLHGVEYGVRAYRRGHEVRPPESR